jgi:hypothetical protein
MQQLMSTSSNQIFRSIQAISDRTGFNVNPDIETSIETVLNYPNKVHFSDLAYFIVKIFPPGGNDLRGKFFRIQNYVTRAKISQCVITLRRQCFMFNLFKLRNSITFSFSFRHHSLLQS